MSEQVSHEIQPSRAAWQRTTAQIIMSQAADTLFSTENLETELRYAEHGFDERRFYSGKTHRFWFKAHTIVAEYFSDRFSAKIKNKSDFSDKVKEEFSRYTFMGAPESAVEEGIAAQVHFPLNLAEVVSSVAEVKGVTGFEARTFSQIGALLRRNDFGTMVDQALFAPNGAWKGFSSTYGAGVTTKNGEVRGGSVASPVIPHIEFTEATVGFSSAYLVMLRAGIAARNRRSRNMPEARHNYIYGPTSGCPVRNLKPHFTASEHDQGRLQELAEHYLTSTDILTVPRQQTVVRDGLEAMAQVLDHYDSFVAPRD